LYTCCLPSFGSFWRDISEEKIKKNPAKTRIASGGHVCLPIRLQTWQPQVILVSDWSISEKIFSSQTASQIKMKLGRQHG
jgi:hypothetical protein